MTPRPATPELETTLSSILNAMSLDETAVEVWLRGSGNDSGKYKDGAGKDHTSKITTGSGPNVSIDKMGVWKKQVRTYETQFLCMKQAAEIDGGFSSELCNERFE